MMIECYGGCKTGSLPRIGLFSNSIPNFLNCTIVWDKLKLLFSKHKGILFSGHVEALKIMKPSCFSGLSAELTELSFM